MNPLPILPGLAAAAALLGSAAQAAEFNTVQLDKSQITFVSRQMGVPVDGQFRKFSAQVAFDPDRPAAGRTQIEIDLAGIDAGSAEANDEVKGKAWFSVREFPTARFVSSGVQALGKGRFEARGQMTIKGRSHEVVVPFTFRQDGGAAVLAGSIPVRRLQYGVGEGVWSDTATVADEVLVHFRFIVGAARK